MKLLLGVDSRVTNRGGFLELDLAAGTHRFHEHRFAEDFRRLGFRGFARSGETIWAVNSAALYRFRYQPACELWLVHEGTLRRPEWERGERAAADLHHVHHSPARDRLFIASSFLDAIDEVTPELTWCGRRYLWDLCPGLERLAFARDPLAADLAHVNHLTEYRGRLYATLGNLNGTRRGAILCVDDGELVLDGLAFPHDGVVVDDTLFLTASDRSTVAIYDEVGDHRLQGREPSRELVVPIRQPAWQDGGQWVRGLAVTPELLVVGATQLRGELEGPERNRVPPRLVVFDRATGSWRGEVFLPELPSFPSPCIYTLDVVEPGVAGVRLDLTVWPPPAVPEDPGGELASAGAQLPLPDPSLGERAGTGFRHWCFSDPALAPQVVVGEGGTTLRLELGGADQRVYLLSGQAPASITRPARRWRDYRLRPASETMLRADVVRLAAGARAQLYLIEYDARGRVGSHSFALREGRNRFRLTTGAGARSYRLALRLAGRGEVTLRGLAIVQHRAS